MGFCEPGGERGFQGDIPGCFPSANGALGSYQSVRLGVRVFVVECALLANFDKAKPVKRDGHFALIAGWQSV